MHGGDTVIPKKDGFLDTNYTLTSTTGEGDLVVPLTADVTTANVPDNKMYVPLTSSSSSVFSLPISLRYMAADPGYDAKKLYKHSKKTLGIDLGLSCRKM